MIRGLSSATDGLILDTAIAFVQRAGASGRHERDSDRVDSMKITTRIETRAPEFRVECPDARSSPMYGRLS